jgi:hypothetical protein
MANVRTEETIAMLRTLNSVLKNYIVMNMENVTRVNTMFC